MAPLALVPILATRWRHFHQLQIWPPDGATCMLVHLVISWPPGCVTCMATLQCVDCPFGIISIELLSDSYIVSIVSKTSCTDIQTSRPINWTPGIPWSEKHPLEARVLDFYSSQQWRAPGHYEGHGGAWEDALAATPWVLQTSPWALLENQGLGDTTLPRYFAVTLIRIFLGLGKSRLGRLQRAQLFSIFVLSRQFSELREP